jgi:predicted DNA-binding protein (MmcQ/YjbR family)
MNHDELRQLCLAWPGVDEGFPFGPEVLVFRVGGKLFLLTNLDSRPLSMNLKCDPERALELRATWNAVQPGWHMNKRHWNTVTVDGSVPRAELMEWVRHSYDLVFASLPAKVRREIAEAGA